MKSGFHKNISSLCCCIILLLSVKFDASAQDMPFPQADYSFNNGEHNDKVSGKEARVVGAKRSEDRFGNKDNAIFLFGSESSYISLGNHSALKPRVGSISLWTNMGNVIWSGTGYTINPILITKRSSEDDFFESYIICYHPQQTTFAAWCSKDSTKQVSITGKEKVDIMTWYHLVITFDDNYFSFYINGVLQACLKKGFQSMYLETDSVLLGITANEKNKRFFHGSIDDIEFYNKVLSEEEVVNLYQSPNPNRFSIILFWVRTVFFIIIVILCIYILIRKRINRNLERYKETLKLQTKLLETELRVNRALMNPHFIFNSLNSIRNLILNNQNDEANTYLLKFSKLMRKILEGNISESITLNDEVDILTRYLELEQLRFQTNFTYTITTEDPITSAHIRLPIMMIQPFVENAIWHGLMNKKGERLLNIQISIKDEKYLFCVVDDNGLGRVENENVFKNRKSMAIIFVRSRLELINKIHNLECKLEIIDKPNSSGTRVEITLPILK
jgi:hypothetical protein